MSIKCGEDTHTIPEYAPYWLPSTLKQAYTKKCWKYLGKGLSLCLHTLHKLGKTQSCNQTVPVVIISPQTQSCIVRNSQRTLNIIPDLHSKTPSTQCCQALGENSWSPSNKFFSDPSSYSFPQRHHTSLKFFNFFKVHNSLKHTLRFCHTLKTTCPRALPSEYLNNNRSLVNQMKETRKWTSKSCSQSQGKHIFRVWKQEWEYRVPSRGLQQSYIKHPISAGRSWTSLPALHTALALIKPPKAYLYSSRFCISSKHNQMQESWRVPKTQIWAINLKLDVI